MIYFYTLIANGTTKSRIPKSFHKALEALEHINALEVKGERICLKPSLILGIIDVSKSGKYFLQSLHKAHSEDFSLQVPKHTFYAKGDIILAKSIGDTKGNTSAIATPAFCHLEPLDEELLFDSPASPLVCHSKHCEETSPELPATPLVCHSEGGRSPTEESLLSTKDSLNETLQRQLFCHSERSEESLSNLLESPQRFFGAEAPQNDNKSDTQGNPHNKQLQRKLLCHSKHCAETPSESAATPLFCHSERSEESLPESLVAKRDSSVVSLPQNDNSGRVSSNSNRDSSLDSQAQNDKITTFTRNPKSNDSQKAHRDSSPAMQAQNDNGIKSARKPEEILQLTSQQNKLTPHNHSPTSPTNETPEIPFDFTQSHITLSQYPAFTYIMANKTHTTLYIGVSSDLIKRAYTHKHHLLQGFSEKYNCEKLVYFESFESIEAAIMREKYLKGKKRTFKEQLISTFNPKWLDLYDYICGNDEAYTIQATSSNPSLYYHKDKQNATKETLATPLFCHHERYGETLHKATRRSLSYCHSEGARSATEESPLSTKDFLKESLERQLVCHSEHCEESLSNLLESPQRFFGAEAPQNDNKSDPQDKITLQGKLVCHSKHCGETPPELPATPLFCHSEGGRSPTEESLLSAKDSLKESLERQLLCHSERSEEYLYESLVAKRDSSVATLPQNDKLCYPQGKPTQDKPPHNKPAKSLKAKPLKLLYRAKAEVLCILEQKKGEIIALELDKPNSRIALKASQKSLRALPPHCVLKVAIASGEIREVLGVLEDPSIDQALALQSATPPHFSQEALNQAKALNAEVYKELYPHRLDLSHLSFCVIDPENAKDHDDAIYFEPETATLYVAIADVSEYVSPNTPLDKEARNRGFSIYFPHKVLPMLPFELSSLACSLRPNHLALALVYILKLSPEGEVLQSELKESLIMPKASISYEQLQRFLDKECLNEEVCDREVLDKKSLNNGFLDKDFKESPNTGSKHLLNHTSHPIPKDMQKWLKAYIPFVKAAKAKRLQNGYEFSSNEVELSLDSIGNISKWQKHTESLAHGVIEESMLLANTQSALLLATHAPKALYRIHPAPKARHIAELLFSFDTLRENSLTPTKGLKNHSNNVPHKNKSLRQKHHKPLSNQALHELISSLQQSAEPALRELVDSLIIKSFARASYACENIGHFGLGFPAYTHFTSPIRRYADLLTHRLLKAILHNAKSLAYLSHDLEAIANELNHKERQVALIERRFYELKALRHCQHLLTTHSPLTIQALTYDSLHALPLDTLPPFPLTFSYEQECYQHIKVEVKSVNLLQKVIYVEPK